MNKLMNKYINKNNPTKKFKGKQNKKIKEQNRIQQNRKMISIKTKHFLASSEGHKCKGVQRLFSKKILLHIKGSYAKIIIFECFQDSE